jgi:hypothetical protein
MTHDAELFILTVLVCTLVIALYLAWFSQVHSGEPCAPPATTGSTEGPGPDKPYYPFASRVEFELAEFLYQIQEMPEMGIDTLMDIWAAAVMKDKRAPPFANSQDMLRYASFSFCYQQLLMCTSG